MNFSDKVNKFLKELESLCIKHKIDLCASDYDSIQLWDSDNKLDFDNISFEDRTKEISDGKKTT